MTMVFLLGRLLMGGYFLQTGAAHFMKRDMLVGYAASKGVPMPKLAVAVSGALLLFGGFGVLVLTFAYLQWALLALALFFVPVSFMMRAYWKEPDMMKAMPDRVNFTKNMGFTGAILIMMYFVNLLAH